MFELDGTLLTSAFKKHQMIGGHDSAAYVKPLPNHNKFKLYLSYRSYMVELLSQLKQDTTKDGQECFELILFSSKSNRADLEVIAESIEKSVSNSGARERIFDQVIGQEDLLYLQDIEFHVLDVNILLNGGTVGGAGGAYGTAAAVQMSSGLKNSQLSPNPTSTLGPMPPSSPKPQPQASPQLAGRRSI